MSPRDSNNGSGSVKLNQRRTLVSQYSRSRRTSGSLNSQRSNYRVCWLFLPLTGDILPTRAIHSRFRSLVMPHYPEFATFSRLASDVHLVPVYRRLIADSLTPVSAFHLLDSGACACLFESVVGGEKVGRYSFLAADPFLQVEARGNAMSVTDSGKSEEFDAADPLAELKARVEQFRAARLPELPPFTS